MEVVEMWGIFGKIILFEVSKDFVEKLRFLVVRCGEICWCCWRFVGVCGWFKFWDNFVNDVMLCDRCGICVVCFIVMLEICIVVLLYLSLLEFILVIVLLLEDFWVVIFGIKVVILKFCKVIMFFCGCW